MNLHGMDGWMEKEQGKPLRREGFRLLIQWPFKPCSRSQSRYGCACFALSAFLSPSCDDPSIRRSLESYSTPPHALRRAGKQPTAGEMLELSNAAYRRGGGGFLTTAPFFGLRYVDNIPDLRKRAHLIHRTAPSSETMAPNKKVIATDKAPQGKYSPEEEQMLPEKFDIVSDLSTIHSPAGQPDVG